jgi:hypothetical protein
MSKSSINFSKKTKLSNFQKNDENISGESNNNVSESIKIIKSANMVKIKSFRFRGLDLDRLQKIVNKTNDVSTSSQFNDTDIIRALLTMGEELGGGKIISYIRKSI